MDYIYFGAIGVLFIACIVLWWMMEVRGDKIKYLEVQHNGLRELNEQYGVRSSKQRDEIQRLQEYKQIAETAQESRTNLETSLTELNKSVSETNAALLSAGKAFVNLDSAIKSARGAGKISPKARADINSKIDKELNNLKMALPKQVGKAK